MRARQKSVFRILIIYSVWFSMVATQEAPTICSPSAPEAVCTLAAFDESNSSSIEQELGSWSIRPQNIRFHYYLESSSNGDLVVRGIVKWKVNLRNWVKLDENVTGFKVSIYELSTSNVLQVKNYDLAVYPSLDKLSENNEDVEFRLQIDDHLSFGQNYRAKVSFLPLKEQGQASAFVSIMNDNLDADCSMIKGLAKFWAPQMNLEISDIQSSVTTSIKLAPKRLCIESYELFIEKKTGGIVEKTIIKVIPGQKTFNYTFKDLERGQPYMVKLTAKNSTLGDCACFGCNCITEKSRFFNITELKEKEEFFPELPFSMNKNLPASVPLPLLLSLFCFVLLLISTIIFYYIIWPRMNKRIRENLLFKLIIPFWRNGKQEQPQKIFIVCAPAKEEEFIQAQQIILSLRDSKHNIKCEQFEKENLEENVLQWISSACAFAEKIIVLHSSESTRGLGVYDLVTALLSPTDNRVAHVKLSPEAVNPMINDCQFILPRDKQALEKAFEISLPNFENEETESREIIVSCEDEQLLNDEQQEEETNTTDSGVSLLSSKPSTSSGNSFTMSDSLDEARHRIEKYKETQFLI